MLCICCCLLAVCCLLSFVVFRCCCLLFGLLLFADVFNNHDEGQDLQCSRGGVVEAKLKCLYFDLLLLLLLFIIGLCGVVGLCLL